MDGWKRPRSRLLQRKAPARRIFGPTPTSASDKLRLQFQLCTTSQSHHRLGRSINHCFSHKLRGLWPLCLGLWASHYCELDRSRPCHWGPKARASASPPSPISRSTIRRPRPNTPIIAIVRVPINLATPNQNANCMPSVGYVSATPTIGPRPTGHRTAFHVDP